MPPVGIAEPSVVFLSLVEREEIAIGRANGMLARAVEAQLARDPSHCRGERTGWFSDPGRREPPA